MGSPGRLDDAQRALDSYEQAKMLSARMARPEDAGSVTAALEDGRFALGGLPPGDYRLRVQLAVVHHHLAT